MNDLEIDRARRQGPGRRSALPVRPPEKELGREGRRAITTAAVLQRLLAARGVRTLLVPFDFPAGLAFQLRRRGFRVRVKEGPSFFDQRQIKQAREVRQITRAGQRAAEAGLGAGIELIRQVSDHFPGKSGTGRRRPHGRTGERGDQQGVLLHWALSEPTPSWPAEPRVNCDPHNEGHGPLPAHRPIILDVFPRGRRDGYWG